METKNTNLNRNPGTKTTQKDSTVPSENQGARIFNAGEIREDAQNLSTQKVPGKDNTIMPGQNADQQVGQNRKPDHDQEHDRSPISNENENRAWNENEKAKDEEKLYVKGGNKNPERNEHAEQNDEEERKENEVE